MYKYCSIQLAIDTSNLTHVIDVLLPKSPTECSHSMLEYYTSHGNIVHLHSSAQAVPPRGRFECGAGEQEEYDEDHVMSGLCPVSEVA